MFVETIRFLVSVAKPIHIILVNHIKNRKTITIFRQLYKHIAVYLNRGYEIKAIRCDPENGLIAQQELLNQKGLYLDNLKTRRNYPSSGVKNKNYKERVRGIINTLPYNLPLNLIPHLIYFCVSRLNMTPNKDNICSAWELLYVRKDNYNILKASFEGFCQAYRNEIDYSMSTRTDGRLTLYDTGNIEGTWYL